ncbi:MAG: YggS family pyridoxal phosphate enzyme [Spirochaetes bacterium GWB1_59_5]|nr:MAG: YggS family pyridoxal phosphate enzyme [Spirochaetes bacterium GWB1_59_5]
MERLNDEYATKIAGNITRVRERMAIASARSGRKTDSVTLLVVTKFNPAEAVLAAYAAGVRTFGENRVQEAEAKFASIEGLIPGSAAHLLGHLQSNKVKKAVALFDCVQSVDSEDILVELARRASDAGKVLDILFELHTGEESKSGFPDADSMFRAMEKAAALSSLRPRGLMTMAPYTDDMTVVRDSFKVCAAAFDKAGALFGFDDFNLLSMGMTNDFEVAIEEGSTIVRIGTAIFGSRVYQ